MGEMLTNGEFTMKGMHEFIVLFLQGLKFFQNKKFESLKSDNKVTRLDARLKLLISKL